MSDLDKKVLELVKSDMANIGISEEELLSEIMNASEEDKLNFIKEYEE